MYHCIDITHVHLNNFSFVYFLYCVLYYYFFFFFRVFSHLYVGSVCLMRRLHLARSCVSSLDNSLSDKSFQVQSNHLRFRLPLLLFPGTSIAITLLPTYSSSLRTTCPYHFNILSCTFLDISPTFIPNCPDWWIQSSILTSSFPPHPTSFLVLLSRHRTSLLILQPSCILCITLPQHIQIFVIKPLLKCDYIVPCKCIQIIWTIFLALCFYFTLTIVITNIAGGPLSDCSSVHLCSNPISHFANYG